MFESVKRLTYRPETSFLAKHLHLRKILRGSYFRLVAPQGIFRARLGEITATFRVRSADELRNLDGSLSLEKNRWGERWLLDLIMRELRPNEVFYDVGANLGLYTVFMAKLVGPQGAVVAFEPNARAYEMLQENVLLNNLLNIRTFQKGLGEQTATRTLYGGSSFTSASFVPSPNRHFGHELAEIVNGDEFVTDSGMAPPNVCKIDVEGYEHAVLKGLQNTLASPNCRLLCVEIHPNLLPQEVKPDDVTLLIKSFGFESIEIVPRGTEEHAICRKA